MEWRAEIVEGFFTPLAAHLGLWAVTHLTPEKSETLFRELGSMTRSCSSLDRLPKGLGAKSEARRPEWEAQLRETD